MNRSKHKSKTDWEYVRNLPESAPIPYSPEDGPYDPNDKAAVKTYWENATVTHKGTVIRKDRGPQKRPTKERIIIHLSPEVVEHFRSTGEGWQTRMDDTLRGVIARQKTKRTA